MIPLETVREFVFEYFPNVSVTKEGTHFHARCVLCGDSRKNPNKKRFHLDWNNGNVHFHCFNCEASGSFITLYSRVKGITVFEARKELFKYDSDYVKKLLTSQTVEITRNNTENISYHNYIIPQSIGVEDTPTGVIERKCREALVKFIEERKIPPEFSRTLRAAYTGDYKGRIVIPIFDNVGNIIYFQGRAFVNIEPKYKNPPVEKEYIILNEKNFVKGKHIIVTEGLIDAFMIGSQGTSMLGASLSERFLEKISKYTDKEIIVCLDNDPTGREKLLKLLKEKSTFSLKYFVMPHKYNEMKDLNQLLVNHDIENVYDFVVENSFEAFHAGIKLAMSGGK